MQGIGALHALFGLSDGEEALESFVCSLAQTYTCSHNSFSKPRQASRLAAASHTWYYLQIELGAADFGGGDFVHHRQACLFQWAHRLGLLCHTARPGG